MDAGSTRGTRGDLEMRTLWRHESPVLGQIRTGLPRMRCSGCLKTFSPPPGTAFVRVRLPEKFHQLLADMFSIVPLCRLVHGTAHRRAETATDAAWQRLLAA